MAQAIVVALPPNLDLDLSCTVVFEAIDATTGNPVTGVLVDNALIRGQVAGTSAANLSSGSFQLIPGPGG